MAISAMKVDLIPSAVRSRWRILSREVIRSGLSFQRSFWPLYWVWIVRCKQKQGYQLRDKTIAAARQEMRVAWKTRVVTVEVKKCLE